MEVALHPVARAAIDRALARERPTTLLFPSPRDANKPLSKDRARIWLIRAEELAGLETQDQCALHTFRRYWVTKRKHLPLVDIAETGGWRNLETLQKSYMKADPRTELQVVMGD